MDDDRSVRNPSFVSSALATWGSQLAVAVLSLANLAYLLAPVVNVTVNGALAAAGVLTVGTAVGTWLGGQTLATLVMAWYVARRSAGFGRPDAGLARRSLAFGVKAHAGRAMLLGNYRLDQWILGAIAGARAGPVQRRRRLGRGAVLPSDRARGGAASRSRPLEP